MGKARVELEAAIAKFEQEKKTEDWSAIAWKKKAEAAEKQHADAREKFLAACEKDNNDKMLLRKEIEQLKEAKNKAVAAANEAISAANSSNAKCTEAEEREVFFFVCVVDNSSFLYSV